MDAATSPKNPDLQTNNLLTSKPVSSPVAAELPHLVVGEEKRSKLGMFGIVILSILLLGIPLGIYLVSQRTQLVPEAAYIAAPSAGDSPAGIFMESKLTSGDDPVIPVDVFVKSSMDHINLVNAEISFNPELLKVERLATSSAELNQVSPFNKWIEADFDNSKGVVNLLAGVANPGIRSSGNDKFYIGTIYFKPIKTGSVILQVSDRSEIFRNSDNINIYRSGNDLALNLSNVEAEATVSARPRVSPKNNQEPLVVVTNPRGGANYSYFKDIEVVWSSFNVDRISQINLYINGEKFGTIAQNIEASEGKYNWLPQTSLGVPYIQPANSYEIEIIGFSKAGEVVRATSGVFGIQGTTEVSGVVPAGPSFEQNQLGVNDISRALSSFLTDPITDASLDLNKDGLINDLDIYLIKLNLIFRGIIK